MDNKYVIAYDVGTSSVKAALIDTELNIVSMSIKGYPVYNPRLGWAEQEPDDYWKAVVQTTKDVVRESGISGKDVKAIAFSCQAMGIIPINDNGDVLHRNISWVDGRAEAEAEAINSLLGENKYGPKSVICKLLWLKKNMRSIYDETKYFLDVNAYLKYRATGKCIFERTGACSYAFDMTNYDWNTETLNAVGIDVDKLPSIICASDAVGTLTETAAAEMGIDRSLLVVGGCNDVEAAAIGSAALGAGEGHIYLGSSAWICAVTSELPSAGSGFTVSKSPTPEGYLLKGVMQSSGMTVDAAISLLYAGEKANCDVDEFAAIESEVSKIKPGSDNLIVTPWIYGETCPVTSESVRSTVFNFANIHTRAHLIKAIREGIGFNLKWINDRLNDLHNISFDHLNIVGGGGLSDDWMQCLADIIQKPLHITANTRHSGAIGVAVCALIGCGVFESFEDAKPAIKIKKMFLPKEKNAATYAKLYTQYRELYSTLEKQYEEINS